MKLNDFEFNLPKKLIAQAPAHPRDHARLLIYDRASTHISDDYFYNLGKYLPVNTTLVVNNSKVEKCRFNFDGVEIFVLQTLDPYTVRALVRPGKKFIPNKTAQLAGGTSVETLAVDEQGIRTLKLSKKLNNPSLDKHRLTPFPPYIKQDESLESEYQTVYADPVGSLAAPTAGLHFTPAQLAKLSISHPIAKITLHVGMGTFAPVKVDEISQHKMHSEDFFISSEAAKILNAAIHTTAVGTTSLRTLESLNKPFKEASGSTDIFITPGYRFKNVDSLITNFHLPKSTLLMLVAAFIGSTDQMQELYAHAIDKRYRFYSFGDAMLVI